MNKKKLCLVIPSLLTGGMERVMSELSWYFCDYDGMEVHIVLYGKKPEIVYSVPVNLNIHKPSIRFIDAFRVISTLKRGIYLRKSIKNINPDSILSFGEYWNSFVILSLAGLKYNIYISDRCSPNMNFGLIHRILRKILYPLSKGMIAQTETAKQMYLSLFPSANVRIIGNPIRSMARSNVIKENVILSVGRLIETKHYDRLMRIFADINFLDWKLVIVGGDAQKQNNMEKLVKLAHELRIEDRVILEGNRLDIETYYSKSKVFAFTSSSEGFPNVIGEAMTAGLPVVAYDCVAGPSDLIEDGENGFLVTLFDDNEFKARLKLLLENEGLRESLGREAANRMKKYSLDNIGKKYSDFILN